MFRLRPSVFRRAGPRDIFLVAVVLCICVYEGIHYMGPVKPTTAPQVVYKMKIVNFGEKVNRLQVDSAVQQEVQLEKKIPDKKVKKSRLDIIIRKQKSKAPKCGLTQPCGPEEYAFYLTSGAGKNLQPEMCFEDTFVMTAEKGNLGRGMNLFLMDPNGPKILDAKTFDSYRGADDQIQQFLNAAPKNSVILVATFDDAARKLNIESRASFGQFGSKLIHQLNFRGSFVMVGQKGLPPGCAIEEVHLGKSFTFAGPSEIGGCIFLTPTIKVGRLEIGRPREESCNKITFGGKLVGKPLGHSNCGVEQTCASDTVPVHMFTGKDNKVKPIICVNGESPISPDKAAVGRGFNLVIFDPQKKQVVKAEHFDTYAEDSSMMEIFLDSIEADQILLGVTFDDASRSLKSFAKKLLEELGASMAQDITLRAAYMFIGQKGIKGRSPYEKMEGLSPGVSWPQPIENHFCLPLKIKGKQGKGNINEGKNELRRAFCKKYDGYSDFCDAENIDNPLKASQIVDDNMHGDDILTVPIIVVPGMILNNLRLTLETLLLQPGIQVDHVMVMYDEKFSEELSNLVKLFGFQFKSLKSSRRYSDQFVKAMQEAWISFPKAENIIFLEEDLLVSSDFLSYFAQLLPTFEKDTSLSAISAWNYNGYKYVSDNSSLVYRVENFPGMGFLLKKSFYFTHIKRVLHTCCNKRSYYDWQDVMKVSMEVLVPDTSRVFHQQYEGMHKDAGLMKELFNKDRITNLDSKAKLLDVDSLEKSKYEEHLEALLKSSKSLDTSRVGDCAKDKIGFTVPNTIWKSYTIYYSQSSTEDHSVLTLLARCFGLFSFEGETPKGLHKELLRFTYNKNHVFLIGSKSPYFKYKPSSVQEIGVSNR